MDYSTMGIIRMEIYMITRREMWLTDGELIRNKKHFYGLTYGKESQFIWGAEHTKV